MTRPEREQVIAQLREALAAELRRQADEPGGGYVGDSYNDEHSLVVDTGVDLTRLAEAAFDTLIEAWFPPF
ncbi:hypothetical protein SEA_NITZEL_82 [Mycobacterium phage Nitzel]|uniref:Uncharacterized protein n=1 Tax=Mycobacterium phage Nitzel TaxID=2652404 RepID=A0A5J6T5A1_9CAUD|nr:hypothetical protein I5H70_gp82 [Mycobacterium phage Nitzel]QFG04907.1 hypothetical protein SEA_NITZEL_82 [Mycobacterium phage Nitzel]